MTALTGRQVVGAAAASRVGTAGIDQTLSDAVNSRRVPGVVGLATNDRGMIYSGAFGVRRLAQPQAMTVDSVFWIASMTKAATTVAAMQMVEQGKLKLDQPASEVLPDLASAQVLEGFDAAGTPRLRPAKRPITLRQLLTHTAGFTYDTFNENAGRYEKQACLPAIITCKDDALKTLLAFDPGDRWEYGINVDFAGKMVEKASGKRLESYFHEHIFVPLGMTDTSFKLSPSQRERLVTMHARGADGALKPIEFEMPQAPEFFSGGAGLYSTGPDYLKFLRMFLNNGSLDGKKVLRPETVAMMGQNQIGNVNVMTLNSVQPDSSRDVEFFPGIVKKWGLGFLINTETAPTGRSAGSLAWAGIANTYFWIDQSRNIAGVVLMQFLPFCDAQALQTFADFESRLYEIT
ncbi:methyl acetate hydrolase [Bradyrhizobium japonicum]|uniref:serine hydrolase domain-containing protein n=1 Tax=Bradyrhizobium TaxID=374 RepID=UPI0009B6C483|nr:MULTISPECIES: serine hydrolase domain-containing protein [Bradyrhizobium]MBR0947965.1 beta-lactamase family protein [Bradyrhizobium liaoningense]MBR1003114.1 beta-lactamase family protein [Bradyrhizobium liaoningense]MBR1026514.1 beta-lactamase family protein [Bradyrhizobium liaoningense]MBR1069300.1 beta-lactamase family protein [Bradyrhizobium liaoningense]MCP1738766.1 CubicO group peptidase (beta-lactamase class C family) [Bradyrhizobium japonicum]